MTARSITEGEKAIEALATALGNYIGALGTSRYSRQTFKDLHTAAVAFDKHSNNLYREVQTRS